MAICDLPDDLLNNILVRLPIESVGQLKYLSKSFNALISSPKFIKSHLNHARLHLQLNKPNLLVPGTTEIKLLEISINNNGDFEDYKSKQIHSLGELQDDRVIKKFLGSSNGLICLLLSSNVDHEPCKICRSSEEIENFCFHDDVFVLCNPLTKSCWDLPGNQWQKRFRSHRSLYGFWYDDVNEDYKVVVMNRSGSERILEYECEVYSLKTNSWSRLRCRFGDDLSYCRDSIDGFLFNSALHWVFYKFEYEDGYIPKLILALDVRTYKTKILSLPKGISCGVWELVMLNNCLGLTNSTDVLWVMEDYGVGNSWMKISVSKNESRFRFSSFIPMEFIHKRLLVSYEAFGNDVALYDTVSGHVEMIEIEFKKPSGFNGMLKLKQIHFVGSLVQPYPPLVAFEKLMISEDGLESFDKFHIYVKGGVSIDSELPEHVRRKYHELCCSKRTYLHKRWAPAVNSRVAARMITKVVEISDSIRSCIFPTDKLEEFRRWDESLRSFELLGMNVGFLRQRISLLLELSFFNEEATNAEKYLYFKSAKAQLEDNIPYYEKWVVDSKIYCHQYVPEIDGLKPEEKAQLEYNIAYYEKWVADSKIQCHKYEAEIDALKPKAESYLARFQEEINGPW